MNKRQNRLTPTWRDFINKTAIGSLVSAITLSSTFMITPDFVKAATTPHSIQAVKNDVAANSFIDVEQNSYYFDAVIWAKSKGIISGYTDSNGNPNGYFGPNDSVTEAQFAKMISQFLGLQDTKGDLVKTTESPQWSDPYYDALASYGAPLNGYFDNNIRNMPIKRGTVAQAIGYLVGDTYDLEDSIRYMLFEGITVGQNPEYENKDLQQFFGTTNQLTRAQVVTFLYRMNTKEITKIGDYANETFSNVSHLTNGANQGIKKLDASLVTGQTTHNGISYNVNSLFQNDFFATKDEVEQYHEVMKNYNTNPEELANDYKKKISHGESSATVTAFSEKIDNLIDNQITDTILGEKGKENFLSAFKGDRLIYSFLELSEEDKTSGNEFPCNYTIGITRSEYLKDFHLLRTELKTLLVYSKISDKDADALLDYIQAKLDTDYKEWGNYEKTVHSSYEYLNNHIVLSYDIWTIMIYIY